MIHFKYILKLISLLYKKDLEIENPKKFQRHVNDIASGVLHKRGYYLNRTYSKFPYLKPNAITNIADFHGLLCFTKHNADFNKISRILGVIFIAIGSLLGISQLLPLFPNTPYGVPVFIILIISGLILFFYKFGKGICIEIRLVGESYRTDIKKGENTTEYLNVRSQARLTVQGNTLDPTRSLSDSDMEKLREDGDVLTEELTPFLEKFMEKSKISSPSM